MSILHTIAVLANIAEEEKEDYRIHPRPILRSTSEAWGVTLARKHPRLFSLFSFLVVFGLIVLILIAVSVYLF